MTYPPGSICYECQRSTSGRCPAHSTWTFLPTAQVTPMGGPVAAVPSQMDRIEQLLRALLTAVENLNSNKQ